MSLFDNKKEIVYNNNRKMNKGEIMQFKDFYEMDAMKYYDKSDDSKLSANLLKKKYDIINNVNSDYIASEKWDGNWMMFLIDDDRKVFARSRSRNTKGIYEDYSVKIPHICYNLQISQIPTKTVLLGEVCWGERGTVATDVGTILRCLPEKAVARQKDKKLVVKFFDILMYAGQDLTQKGYIDRVRLLEKMFSDKPSCCGATTWYYNNFAEEADRIIAQGGEGLVIQKQDYTYEPGKRTAWKTLKLKQKLPEVELKVIGTLEPEKEFTGDTDLSVWPYWIDNKPVTKPYYYGWKVGVIVDFNGVEVKVSSGLTDSDRDWLKSNEATEHISNGTLFAVVRGMAVTDDGSIRHPVLQRLRTDIGE